MVSLLLWCVAPSWWGCVASSCVVLCGVGVRCVVLCCVVLCVMLVSGPPRGGACCVGVWPPSWWGMLRWGAMCCVVCRCVGCGGVWSFVWWGVLRWCVAPLMVGLCCVVLCCLALGCGLLRPGRCVVCVAGVWPPS